MTRSSRGQALTRAAAIGAAAAAALVLLAVPAFAHITVTPGSAAAGSSSELTFHVPNEAANADTVKVDVQIPTDHPIAQLLAKPVTGWTVAIKTVTLAKPLVTDDGSFSQAVSEVIWSGGQIAPGQFQDFSVSADPLPVGVSQLAFKAIQTYSNGDVVRWIDLPQPGQPDPAHPAPVVMLTTATAPAAAVRSSATPASSATSGSSSALGLAGLIVGLLACLLALMVARQNRRLITRGGRRGGALAATDLGEAAGEPSGDRMLAG
ncbi:MAG TPA: YcnI family protein, partial [Streptosporangiaceae bacterium]|nr:YcnI family protein [Streptosporangiaceae bacterium]